MKCDLLGAKDSQMFHTTMFLPLALFSSLQDRQNPVPNIHGRVADVPVVGHYKDNDAYAYRKKNILRGGIEGGKVAHYHTFMMHSNGLERLCYAHGCFWVNDQVFVRRIPEDELPLYDLTDQAAKRYREKYPKDRGYPGVHLSGLDPVLNATAKETWDAFVEKREPPSGRAQRFHFLPTSATTGKVFLFFARRSWIELWDGKFRWLPDEQRSEAKWAEREEEVFACPFSEDFYVFAKDTTYFFLTRSGQLYLAEKSKK